MHWKDYFAPAIIDDGQALLSSAGATIKVFRIDHNLLFADVRGGGRYRLRISFLTVDLAQQHFHRLETDCSCATGAFCAHAVATLQQFFSENPCADDFNTSEIGTKKSIKKSTEALEKLIYSELWSVHQVADLLEKWEESNARIAAEENQTKNSEAHKEVSVLQNYLAEKDFRVEFSAIRESNPLALHAIKSLLRTTTPNTAHTNNRQKYVVFGLFIDREHHVEIFIGTAERGKQGNWRALRFMDDIRRYQTQMPDFATEQDYILIAQLNANRQKDKYSYRSLAFDAAEKTAALIQQLAATNKLFYYNAYQYKVTNSLPLCWAEAITLTPSFSPHPDKKEQFQLHYLPDDDDLFLLSEPPIVVRGNNLHPIKSELGLAQWKEIIKVPSWTNVEAAQAAQLLRIDGPPITNKEVGKFQPVALLWNTSVSYVQGKQRHFIDVLSLVFRYGEHTVSPNSPSVEVYPDGPLRDLASEEKMIHNIKNFQALLCGLSEWNNYPWKLNRTDIVALVPISLTARPPRSHFAHLPIPESLLEQFVACGWRIESRSGAVKERTIIDADEITAETTQKENDWFQLHVGVEVNGEKIDLVPHLAQLVGGGEAAFSALESDKKDTVLFAIGNGRVVRVPTQRLRRMVEFISSLFAREQSGYFITPDMFAALDDMSDVLPRWHGREKIAALAQRLSALMHPGEADVPEHFVGTLRPYQRQGLAWLQRLREASVGGILADDMGLGKTVQVLAFLCAEKNNGRLSKPALVICPASVMDNWYKEAKKFVPHLVVTLHHGLKRKLLSHDGTDIVITTYGTMLRDAAEWAERAWSFIICDEAQFLKNAQAKSAQAVRSLKGDLRLSLSGTPMENHLGELWAQMHWLNPGILGSQAQFDNTFRHPIEKQGDKKRMVLLQRRMTPFLLRRTKNIVAKDLPAKTQSVLSVRLSGAQRDLYEVVRLAMDERLTEVIRDKGFKRSRIEVFDALLKLRQTCCDPRLVKMKKKIKAANSAKLDALMELLPTLIEDGRRILIFSQFTSMLELIAQALTTATIPFIQLTGDTPVAERGALMDKFQTGSVPVFLISLKAGGTGLNLTAADTVILYDPWWNPAVEDQAIDRAHRIGQDKPVFVYRLVAHGTVEERMLELQQRKRDLADALYGDEENMTGNLSEADIAALLAPIED
jgi:superfamily II DNA or RNA helicase